VAGGAADHAGEEVGLGAAAAGTAGALLEAVLGPGEQLVRDERQVLDLGDDPLLFGPEAGGAAGLAVGGEVEPVPDQPPGVGGVLEQRPDRALGPVAAEVALYVDVGGRWRTAGAVEVIGDRLAPVAAVGPQVEDLGDDLGTLRIGDQAGLGLPGLRARGHWVRTLRRAPQPTAKTERRAPARPRDRDRQMAALRRSGGHLCQQS
jgi:hypothetical protein